MACHRRMPAIRHRCSIVGRMADDPAERLKQLETENRRLVAMLDSIDDHLILLDSSSRVLFLNRATEAVAQGNYGASRHEVVGRHLSDGAQTEEFKAYMRGL